MAVANLEGSQVKPNIGPPPPPPPTTTTTFNVLLHLYEKKKQQLRGKLNEVRVLDAWNNHRG